jgi:hypothetical protein
MSDIYSPLKRKQRLPKHLPDLDKVILSDVLALPVDSKDDFKEVVPPSPFPSTESEEEIFISSITEDEDDCNILDISITESLFEKSFDEKVAEVICVKPKPEPCVVKVGLTLGSILERTDYKTKPYRTGSRLSKNKFKTLSSNMKVSAEKDAIVRFTFKPPFPVRWLKHKK